MPERVPRSDQSHVPPLLGESLLSKRRMRPIMFLLAAFVIVATFAAAAFFGFSAKKRDLARQTVERMANAPSYSASGVDTTIGPGVHREVSEQFTYNAPDRIWSRYLVASEGSGAADIFSSVGAQDCRNQEVIIVGAQSFQRCNDSEYQSTWIGSEIGYGLFNNIQFRPWERFAWCNNIEDQGEDEILGEPVNVYTCRVPNRREADLFWPITDGMDPNARQERQRFIEEASIELTAWVRVADGYLARFALHKVSPVQGGVITQTLDYTYSDFDQAERVEAPVVSLVPVPLPTEATPSTSTPELAVIQNHVFKLEVADNDYSLTKGLSNRPVLLRDEAMLFVFPSERNWSLWMKDVLIPLDMLFITSDGTIVDIQTAQPEPGLPDDRLTVYESPVPVKYALEMNGGLADELGIGVGMQVDLR